MTTKSERQIITSGAINLPATKTIKRAVVTWQLQSGEKGATFSAQGSIDYKDGSECGGQCLDELVKEYPEHSLLNRVHAVWSEWHLNDLNAGTPEQTAAVEKWEAEGNKYDYSAVCEMLKACGLYMVEATPEVKASALGGFEQPFYTYGCRWLYRAIPDFVQAEIHSWNQ